MSSLFLHPLSIPGCLFQLGKGAGACAGGQTVIMMLLPGAEHPVLAVLLALVSSWCDLEEVTQGV